MPARTYKTKALKKAAMAKKVSEPVKSYVNEKIK